MSLVIALCCDYGKTFRGCMYGHEWYLFSYCLSVYLNVRISFLWGIHSGEGVNFRQVSNDAGYGSQ